MKQKLIEINNLKNINSTGYQQGKKWFDKARKNNSELIL